MSSESAEWVSDKGGQTPVCATCKADMVFERVGDAVRSRNALLAELKGALGDGKDLVVTAYRLENRKLRVVVMKRDGIFAVDGVLPM